VFAGLVFSIIFLAFFCITSACSNTETRSIERQDLAFFDIGRIEGDLDLFNLEGRRSQDPTGLTMRDGQFYIANGNGQKIVRYNSYGDLLFMIYNEETNPPPVTLKPKSEGIETRWANPWPLQYPSHIAVDSRKNIFVVDTLPDERHSYNKTEKAIMDRIVLHFDSSGRFIEYLGQEGPGGTPFTLIENLAVTQNDQLLVICRVPKGRIVYTYDANGNQLSEIRFSNDRLPVPENREGVLPSLDGIAVSPDTARIYIKIDYYHEIFDAAINTAAGIEPDSSYLWSVDLESGEYISHTEIPFFESIHTENGKRVSENLLYSMFGAMRGGKLFFYSPVEDGFSILILNTEDPNKQRRGVIKAQADELQFFTFNVSEEGVLSALLADNFRVKLVWWRTDKLAEEM
jgi:DNA-binding beta-propeller fold protein YncE